MRAHRWFQWVQQRMHAGQIRKARRASLRRRFGRTWNSECLEPRVLLTPAIVSFELANDTGTAGDNVTTDATVTGTTSSDSNPDSVELDVNGDGLADVQIEPDADGRFTYYLDQDVTYGEVTVSARAYEYGEEAMVIYSAWVTLNFTYEPPPPPEVASLALLNDTGDEGDHITTDATLTGTAGDQGTLPADMIEFDCDGDGVADASTSVDAGGAFTYDVGPHIPHDPVTVWVRAGGYGDDATVWFGEWVSISFTYITPNLAPVITSFAAIEGPDGVWHFEGTVDDEVPDWCNITFGGVLEGHSIMADADGTFRFGITLTPEQEGVVTAQATDYEGLSSEVVEDLVYMG